MWLSSRGPGQFHSGWQWASIEGRAVLAGPNDPQPWLSTNDLPSLLRAIFIAAGGQHDDWDEFDAELMQLRVHRRCDSSGVVAASHCYVFVTPSPVKVGLPARIEGESPVQVGGDDGWS